MSDTSTAASPQPEPHPLTPLISFPSAPRAPKAARDPAYMLMLIVAGLFGELMVALLFVNVPKDNRELLLTLSGVLATAFATLVGFYFGSSQSSRAKDQTISNLAPPAPTAPPQNPV